jgi:branched-chain amino acid transport system ATP-binding protein
LFVLFGFNAVDELDRTAFSVLLPDIRDDFGLSTGALSIVSATTIAVLIIAVPLAFYCDRANRSESPPSAARCRGSSLWARGWRWRR